MKHLPLVFASTLAWEMSMSSVEGLAPSGVNPTYHEHVVWTRSTAVRAGSNSHGALPTNGTGLDPRARSSKGKGDFLEKIKGLYVAYPVRKPDLR